MRSDLLLIQLLGILSTGQSLPRHWKRAPVQGTFNVDLYAYNKPSRNLALQEAASQGKTQALPMGQLLKQLSHSSRSTKVYQPQYRNFPDKDTSDTSYSHEFQVQNMGAKKIVQLNKLTSNDTKPSEVEMQKEEQLEQPLKVNLSLPEQLSASTVATNTEHVLASEGILPADTTIRPARLKSKRKRTQTTTTTPNEMDTKMTTNVTPTPTPTVSHVKKPVKELATQSPDISTHRPKINRKGATTKKPSKRRGTQRRPAAAAATTTTSSGQQEEIETTTNWWQILPYAEIRKFLNTIYDSIADEDGDGDDERAGGREKLNFRLSNDGQQ